MALKSPVIDMDLAITDLLLLPKVNMWSIEYFKRLRGVVSVGSVGSWEPTGLSIYSYETSITYGY